MQSLTLQLGSASMCLTLGFRGNEEKKTVGIRSCSKDFQIDDLSPPPLPQMSNLAFFELQETSLSACG